MARNRVHVHASPEEVFAILADPHCYPRWVVGAAGIRHYDEEFPAIGSRFHHEVGSWPVGVKDYTEVTELDPPTRIVLKAKARPLGTATIALELRESAGGTEVRMEEVPGDRLTSLVVGNPVADTALRVRNAEALARLKRLVEGVPEGDPMRERELSGQRVLVTGGSSGIGLAVAQGLEREGARVAILARNELGLAAAKRNLTEAGGATIAVSADVTDREGADVGGGQSRRRAGRPRHPRHLGGEPLLRPLHRDRPRRLRRDARDRPRRHRRHDPRGAAPPRGLPRRDRLRRLDRRPHAAAGNGRLHHLQARAG